MEMGETKARLRADLVDSMRQRKPMETRVIRTLLAALDNAEAVPAADGPRSCPPDRFAGGSAEAERRLLAAAQVRAVLMNEVQERERTAAELDRLGQHDRAALLRAEASIARRYLG